MNITTRLFLSFISIAILPLSLIGFMGLAQMQAISRQTMDESTDVMRRLGEDAIRQKALDVAAQVALYLEAHPELGGHPDRLMADAGLAGVAVQPVGLTGYTAVYDSSGVTYAHVNPALVGLDMALLAEDLPEFWAIFSASLDGSLVGSYYEWAEPDGSLREKYMYCVPVVGSSLRVAATTYIDEFYQPITMTETRAAWILERSRVQLLVALLVVAVLAFALSIGFSSLISRPINALVSGFKAVEGENYQAICLEGIVGRQDEFGRMARVFTRMADQVSERVQTLKNQVAYLRIEVDEAKRNIEVRQITETEYFQDLLKKASLLRGKRPRRQTPV
jgi:HAMP domain-containing protein